MTCSTINIVLVDDEAAHVEAIRRGLERSSLACSVTSVGSLAEFRALAAERAPDIALVDLNLPDGRALELLGIPLPEAEFPILIMTSHGTEHTAVEALKAGALDYVVKSAESFAGMSRSVERALREWGLIKERRRAEEALLAAKESAESANRAKSDFLALMSHELRTPLNGIMGGVQMLRGTRLSPEQAEYLEMVMTCAENQLSLVIDLLDLARLDSLGMGVDAAEFPLRHSVEETVKLQKGELKRKGLSLEVCIGDEVPELVVGDALRFRQILLKLVSNAVKFTERGGVTVRVGLASRELENLILRCCVSDTGIGVADEHRDAIFAPFVQVDMSSTRKYGGSGLGLTLCRRLTEALGGRIWYEKSPGEGSVFCFELPLRIKEAAASAQPVVVETSPAPVALTGLSVLLADDDAACLKVFPVILGKLGCRVVTAVNGREAVDRWEDSGPFDVILMDVQMPVLSGPEALHAIRARERELGGRVPIVAQTAFAMKKDEQRLLSEGFDGYLAKPLMIPEMIELIRELAGLGADGEGGRRADGGCRLNLSNPSSAAT